MPIAGARRTNSPSVIDRLAPKGSKQGFFFEKKNQKTFIRLARTQMDKSIFASFFSEKEDSSLHG
jgi:hypothetical protein